MTNIDNAYKKIHKKEGTEYWPLIVNARGVDRAIACGCTKVKLNISASRAHNFANLNRTSAESVAGFFFNNHYDRIVDDIFEKNGSVNKWHNNMKSHGFFFDRIRKIRGLGGIIPLL